MADDSPSLGEIIRRLGDVRADTREDIAELRIRQEREWVAVHARMDQLVTRDRYEAERTAMLDRISKLEAASEKRVERSGMDWRQFLWSGIIPAAIFLAGVLVQLMIARGGR
ncbi:hypothetical protein ACQEVF_32400 [Nonomuraea polychroma]|uniref:hypothetical protein n=1 Tax=Nonomuraea polychroma TaxID=46176 RepID=UPI003D8F9516